MNLLVKYLLVSTMFLILLSSCQESSDVDSSTFDDSSLENKTGIFADEGTSSEQADLNKQDFHVVLIEKVLSTSDYIYLFVKEGDREPFWIATTKQDVIIGNTYYYKGGFLQTNFESKEHNRTFDTLYLVSRITPVNHKGAKNAGVGVKKETTTSVQPIEREGSVRIVDLVANPEKYDGQIIQISGECVKVNPEIMDRNWMHFKDGSLDDFDLVLTSDIAIPKGEIVTMQGKVVLNKDFGAGYRYDIMIEEGVLVKQN